MSKLLAAIAIALCSLAGSSSFARPLATALTDTRAERLAEAILPQALIEQGVTKFARENFETEMAQQPQNVRLEQQYPGISAACESAVQLLMLDLAREDLPSIRKALTAQNETLFSATEMDRLIAFYAAISPAIHKVALSPVTKDAAQLDPPRADVDRQVGETVAAMTPQAKQLANELMESSAGQKFVQSAPARQALIRGFMVKSIEKGRQRFAETIRQAAKTYIAQRKAPQADELPPRP